MDPPCEEKLRLAQAVARAMETVYSLKLQHAAAVKHKDAGANRLLALLERARTTQQNAERNLREHVAAHECGRPIR